MPALRSSRLGRARFQVIGQSLRRVAQQRGLAIILSGVLAFAGNAIVSLLKGIPSPSVHDEFSYLLAADTFAHGRLSNPTHPLWVHFESFHILQHPTYASKYHPAQGMVLAVGQIIGGHPIVGVWISVGLMGAALCWMLQAWLPPGWAFLGALLACVQTGILGYWGQSYWGGAVAAAGGALVFGALRRTVSRLRTQNAVLMGIGLAVLANSRPYEGLVASLPAAVMLLAWMADKNSPPALILTRKLVLPIFVILTVTGGLMGFYNLRVTGNAFRLPYQTYEATYNPAPLFVWQHPRPGVMYHNSQMREAHSDLLKEYLRRRSARGFSKQTVRRFARLWKFYLGPALTIPLLTLPWILRDQWLRFALLTCGVETAALLLCLWGFPHYVAPITGLIYALVFQGMRHLYLWQRQDKPSGQLVLWGILAVFLASVLTGFGRYKSRNERLSVFIDRPSILTQLKQYSGRHLILVRYGLKHNWHNEWVYNEADIDAAEVVWARELDELQNRKLIAHFADRQVWRLEVVSTNAVPKLTRYPAEPVPAVTSLDQPENTP